MIVIYDSIDLIKQSQDKTIRQIDMSDFRFSSQPIQLAHIVIFLDADKDLMRIMKYRGDNNFDTKAIYSSSDFTEVIKDYLTGIKSLGKSLMKPGTGKLKEK